MAAKAGDTQGLAKAKADWYANANQIAAFLAAANPNWALADLQSMMKTHLDETLAEATARLTGDWNGDVAAYDAVVAHIEMMADTFTSGITAQFPDMVAPSGISAGDETLHVDMRQLWEDHVTWTRVFLMGAIAGLPDTDVATARLLQNQVDIGNAVKPFYGNAAGDQLTVLLKAHITLAAAVVTAATAEASHGTALQQAEQKWFANADQIAAFLANVEPGSGRRQTSRP